MTRARSSRALLTSLLRRRQELEDGIWKSNDYETAHAVLTGRIDELLAKGVEPEEAEYPMGIRPRGEAA